MFLDTSQNRAFFELFEPSSSHIVGTTSQARAYTLKACRSIESSKYCSSRARAMLSSSSARLDNTPIGVERRKSLYQRRDLAGLLCSYCFCFSLSCVLANFNGSIKFLIKVVLLKIMTTEEEDDNHHFFLFLFSEF